MLIRAISNSGFSISKILSNLRPFLKLTVIEIGIVVGLLLAGGYLEDYMIKLVQEKSIGLPSF